MALPTRHMRRTSSGWLPRPESFEEGAKLWRGEAKHGLARQLPIGLELRAAQLGIGLHRLRASPTACFSSCARLRLRRASVVPRRATSAFCACSPFQPNSLARPLNFSRPSPAWDAFGQLQLERGVRQASSRERLRRPLSDAGRGACVWLGRGRPCGVHGGDWGRGACRRCQRPPASSRQRAGQAARRCSRVVRHAGEAWGRAVDSVRHSSLSTRAASLCFHVAVRQCLMQRAHVVGGRGVLEHAPSSRCRRCGAPRCAVPSASLEKELR
jgi:hypothetical protein